MLTVFLLFRVSMTQWIALEQANVTMTWACATGTVQQYKHDSNKCTIGQKRKLQNIVNITSNTDK